MNPVQAQQVRDAVEIIKRIASATGIDPSALRHTERRCSRKLAPARAEAIRELRMAGYSLPVIGKAFGIHHTSVISILRKGAPMNTDLQGEVVKLRLRVRELEETLGMVRKAVL